MEKLTIDCYQCNGFKQVKVAYKDGETKDDVKYRLEPCGKCKGSGVLTDYPDKFSRGGMIQSYKILLNHFRTLYTELFFVNPEHEAFNSLSDEAKEKMIENIMKKKGIDKDDELPKKASLIEKLGLQKRKHQGKINYA